MRTVLGIVCLLLASCGSAANTTSKESMGNSNSQVVSAINSGDPQIDKFLADVMAGDSNAVSKQVGGFESISGLPMEFNDAAGYLSRVKGCSVANVSSRKEPSFHGWFEVSWSCPNGTFRQTVNTTFHAPKITLSELH